MASEGRKLLQGGYVLTMDPALGEMADADVLIEGDRIALVAPHISAGDAEIIDARGTIVMPGFIDCHRHMWQTQLRALTADWSLYDYSSRIRSIYSSFYDPDDAYLGCYAGFLDAINAGITTIIDHSHIMNSPDHADEVVRAFTDSGIRGVLCYGMFGNPAVHEKVSLGRFLPPAWHFDDVRRLRTRYFSSDDGRVMLGIALTEAEFFPMEYSRREIALARAIGARRISAHCGLGAMSAHTRYVLRLHRAGLLGPDFHFVHGWSLTDHELRLLADSGACLVCTPETELQMGMGFPVTSRVLAAGGRAGLGIDIVSNQSADMFTQMRLNLQVQRALENEEMNRKGLMPTAIRMKAGDILKVATSGGARAAGLDGITGSLTPGRQADIIMIRADRAGMVPLVNPVGAVVMSAGVGDVDSVFIAGVPVKRGGALIGVDWPSVSARLARSSKKIIAGGAGKGFSQGEAVMRAVFPIDAKTALLSRIGGLIMRSPFTSLQNAVTNYFLKMY